MAVNIISTCSRLFKAHLNTWSKLDKSWQAFHTCPKIIFTKLYLILLGEIQKLCWLFFLESFDYFPTSQLWFKPNFKDMTLFQQNTLPYLNELNPNQIFKLQMYMKPFYSIMCKKNYHSMNLRQKMVVVHWKILLQS